MYKLFNYEAIIIKTSRKLGKLQFVIRQLKQQNTIRYEARQPGNKPYP